MSRSEVKLCLAGLACTFPPAAGVSALVDALLSAGQTDAAAASSSAAPLTMHTTTADVDVALNDVKMEPEDDDAAGVTFVPGEARDLRCRAGCVP